MFCGRNKLKDIHLPKYESLSQRYGEEDLDEKNVFVAALETVSNKSINSKAGIFDFDLWKKDRRKDAHFLAEQDHLDSPIFSNEDLNFFNVGTELENLLQTSNYGDSTNFIKEKPGKKLHHIISPEICHVSTTSGYDIRQNNLQENNRTSLSCRTYSFKNRYNKPINTKLQQIDDEKIKQKGHTPVPQVDQHFQDLFIKSHTSVPQVDLHLQEILKKERKKSNNRLASSKCRKRKLERQAQLNFQVNTLEIQNIELETVADMLRKQATILKLKVIQHINEGCDLTVD